MARKDSKESPKKHALVVLSRTPLNEGSYYIRKVHLKDFDGSFLAEAEFVPWSDTIKGPSPWATVMSKGTSPAIQESIRVPLAYGGMRLHAESLSMLNLLSLQGKRVSIKGLGKEQGYESGPDLYLYHISEVETLLGPEFKRALATDYGPQAEES